MLAMRTDGEDQGFGAEMHGDAVVLLLLGEKDGRFQEGDN